MVIIRYVLCVIGSLLGTLLAMLLVNWWAPAICDAQGNLPRWLKWFQTFDASCDAGWRDGYINASWGETPVRRFFARVYWLYRNPAYGWDYWPLGVPFVPTDWRVVRYVDTDVLTLFIAISRVGFNVYYHGRWGMLKVGWKAWNCWGGTTWNAVPFGPEWRLPVAFTLTPFKRK